MSDKILHGQPDPDNLTNDTKSLGEFCINQLKKHGDQVVVIDSKTSNETTAAEILKESIRVAKVLSEHYGIKSGDCVGICSENRIEYCPTVIGCWLIGATVSPIVATYVNTELNHNFLICKPKLVFASADTIDKVTKVALANSFIEHIIVYGVDSTENKDHRTYNQFLSFVKSEESDETFECSPQDIKDNVAVIIYSSGTTGMPKGAEITQWNMFSIISQALGNVKILTLLPSPFSFGSGFMTMFSNILKANRTVLLADFDEDSYFKCIEKFKIAGVYMNPGLMNSLAKTNLATRFDLSSLMFVIYGAAPISQDIIEAIQQKLESVILLQVYGLTESWNTLLGPRGGEIKAKGSVGKLAQSCSGKVVNPDTDEILGPNERGELLFKSNRVIKGYAGLPELTASAFDADGFFRTGDIGYYDENGEWFIIDRIKELIKYNGNMVVPAEIEGILLTHPCVRDACVVGKPDREAAELPCAFIVKDGDVSEQEIIDYIADRLSSPKHLRGGVRFIDEIPRNPNGKRLRRVLRDMTLV